MEHRIQNLTSTGSSFSLTGEMSRLLVKGELLKAKVDACVELRDSQNVREESERKEAARIPLTQTPQDHRRCSSSAYERYGRRRSARMMSHEESPQKNVGRTVDATAAGTLAMIDMTALRFNSIKVCKDVEFKY